uniref:Uncharacterized protein n=1 Tax=Glossina morsitans morsitans TaxID=37546 RepID=A0A1B0G358_GLOMM
MKFWIILTLLAISTRASIATFILTNLLLRGINAGFEETIGVGIGPAKFGLKKNINLHLGRFPQKRARGTPDYPYYNQTNYTRNYPRVPAPRLGRGNAQANYTQGPLPYDQVNFPANNSYVLVPGYGQPNYSANYPQVPGPKRGQRKYQANYPNVPGPSTAYGAAVPLLGLNLGIGANIGLGSGDRGSPHMYHSGYREEEGGGIGVGIGAGIGLGLL